MRKPAFGVYTSGATYDGFSGLFSSFFLNCEENNSFVDATSDLVHDVEAIHGLR